MALGLQQKLNRFQFERTVDWRICFTTLYNDIVDMGTPDSKKIASALKRMFYVTEKTAGDHVLYLFAKSVDLGVSMVRTTASSTAGFYDSDISYPQLNMTLYTDVYGSVEKALQIWSASSYLADGTMPVFQNRGEKTKETFKKYGIINPVQNIVVQRIIPIRMGLAFQNLIYDTWVPLTETSAFDLSNKRNQYEKEHVLEEYYIGAYLESEPRYNGLDTPSIRTVTLTCGEVSFRRHNPLTYGFPVGDAVGITDGLNSGGYTPSPSGTGVSSGGSGSGVASISGLPESVTSNDGSVKTDPAASSPQILFTDEFVAEREDPYAKLAQWEAEDQRELAKLKRGR